MRIVKAHAYGNDFLLVANSAVASSDDLADLTRRACDRHRGIGRVGARYTISSWRADGAVLFGVTERDPGFGFTFGATYVFDAFRVP